MKSIKLFFSYSHKDEELRDELAKQLVLLKRQGFIEDWHDRTIDPGDDWRQAIERELNRADIILLLVSPDFLASNFCYDREMLRAVERHEAGDAAVIPIILRPSDNWEAAPFGKLQALPVNRVPITRWTDQDEAFANVAAGIRRVVGKLLNP
jgi:hypothetical protein